MRRIYLDHAATTPLLPGAREAMQPWLRAGFGNASSLHEEGRKARAAIDEAREILSGALGCLFAEVLFTSSGTEAANMAVIGAALAGSDPGRRRILLGASEHHCVLHTAPILERLGYRVQLIPVDRIGQVRLDLLGELLGEDLLLASVMEANNELGTLQPITEISAMVHRYGALMHSDAVQTLGLHLGERIGDFGPDMVTFSAHKVYGPQGVGAIYVKAGTKLKPILVGGGQEREMRSGTENVAGIVGFGSAVRLYPSLSHVRKSRDAFLDRLIEYGFVPTVPCRDAVLDSHAHVRLPGVDAETMLIRLDRAGVSASSGAACSSGSLEPSHVLLACGYSQSEAREGLRFTFGRSSTVEDAKEAASRVIEAADSVRNAGG